MDGPQLSPVPPLGKRPSLHDLGWLTRLGARAFYELVRARIAFASLKARDIPNRNEAARQCANSGARIDPTDLSRISFILPRLSARLPWRSDCLVQAIAGQNWLAAHGLASEIQIGVRRHETEAFGAHAWLVHEGQIVSGGDISSYELLLGDQDAPSQQR